MEKILRRISIMLSVIMMLGIFNLMEVKAYADAADDILKQLNEMNSATMEDVRVAQGTIKAYSDKSSSSDVAHTYSKGEVIYVSGSDTGWIEVFFQGDTLYIEEKDSKLMSASGDIDMDTVDRELEQIEADNVIIISEIERVRAETKRSRMWGIVIILIIVVVFIVGLVTMIQNRKKEKQQVVDVVSKENSDNTEAVGSDEPEADEFDHDIDDDLTFFDEFDKTKKDN